MNQRCSVLRALPSCDPRHRRQGRQVERESIFLRPRRVRRQDPSWSRSSWPCGVAFAHVTRCSSRCSRCVISSRCWSGRALNGCVSDGRTGCSGVWFSRLWADWRGALVIVKPDTVIAWHRKGFRRFWTWKPSSTRENGDQPRSPHSGMLVRTDHSIVVPVS